MCQVYSSNCPDFSLNELLWLVNDEIHHFVFRQVSLAAHETLSEKLQVPFMSNVKFFLGFYFWTSNVQTLKMYKQEGNGLNFS